MATQCYDCFFLFDSNKYNRDPGGVAAALHKTIESHTGEILASRLWEERKLAYPIDGHNKGTYWITYFNMDTSKLPEFNRACQLDENIIRHLVTRVDPRLVEPLVAHALGKTPVAEPADEKPVAVGAQDFDDSDTDEDE
ncbi:MAG: 30S ribosomal protein S6 [Pirellulaceae bacterium]